MYAGQNIGNLTLDAMIHALRMSLYLVCAVLKLYPFVWVWGHYAKREGISFKLRISPVVKMCYLMLLSSESNLQIGACKTNNDEHVKQFH